jgi:pyruvate dehydrogenase E2 component (dihydrolipoamide acetyltransferase)
MAYNIVMPQLSDSMTEGTLVEWKVQPGQQVKAGDIIAEVESDKAIQELQTFHDGVVSELTVNAGEVVPVGTVIAVLDSSKSAKNVAKSEPTPSSAPASQKLEEKRSESNAQLQTAEKAVKPTTEAITAPASSSEQETAPAKGNPEKPSSLSNEEQQVLSILLGAAYNPETKHHSPPHTFVEEHAQASPKAKQLAQKYGLDLPALQKEGKLPTPAHENDVVHYYLTQFFSQEALKLIEQYQLDLSLFGSDKKHTKTDILRYISEHNIPLRTPLNSMQRAIIRSVTQSAQKPIYHIYDRLSAEQMLAHKEVSVTTWLIKLIGDVMMEFETLRTQLENDQLAVYPDANIAVAIAVGDALYMPVIHRVNRLPVEEIQQQLKTLVDKAKKGRMTAEEMQGSTFAISNLGMLGIERFDAMINANDVGIAAIGGEEDGKIRITLTFDHRLINGYPAAQCVQRLKALAEDPASFSIES